MGDLGHVGRQIQSDEDSHESLFAPAPRRLLRNLATTLDKSFGKTLDGGDPLGCRQFRCWYDFGSRRTGRGLCCSIIAEFTDLIQPVEAELALVLEEHHKQTLVQEGPVPNVTGVSEVVNPPPTEPTVST